MAQSLHSFTKAHGIPKTTAFDWLKAQGFDTSNGLDEAAIAALSAHFGLSQQPQAQQPIPPTATTYTVPSPDALALPKQPEQLALGNIGGGQLADFQPEDIDRFLSACDVFQQAIDTDWERQQQLAKRKAAAAQQVKAKVAEVRQSATLYQARSDAAAMLNQQLDSELSSGMGELGKYSAAPGEA